MTPRILLLLIVIFCSGGVTADSSVRVHPLHFQDNYRQDQTWGTLRDRAGYLWLATDNGLRRYDGYALKFFTHHKGDPNSLSPGNIHALLQDTQGTIWAGGLMLNRYHPETETFTRYEISEGKSIYALFEDPRGDLWIGGTSMGLRRFDPATGQVAEIFFSGQENTLSIFSIRLRGDAKQLWLATNQGLLAFDLTTHTSTHYFTPPEASGTRLIFGMEEHEDGTVWLATGGGIYIVDPVTRSVRHIKANISTPGAIATDNLSSLAKDQLGRMWIGTDKHGVYRYRPQSDDFVHFPASANDQYRFPLSRITHIQEDYEGNIWFATSFHGVFRVSEHLQKFKAFQHSFDTDNSLIFNNILALYEDRAGFIWIATDGGGLDRFNPNTYEFTHFRHDPNDTTTLSTNSVLDIVEDSKGFLWLGTWAGGLNRLDPQTGEVLRILRDPNKSADQTMAGNNIFRLVIDAQDRLFMSIAGVGLQIYDIPKGTFQTYPAGTEGGVRTDYINDIVPTNDGRYWIAGYSGLEVFSPDTGSQEIPAEPITDSIFDLYKSSDGLLWIGTSEGLVRFNPVSNETTRFTVQDGLADNYVVGIEQDSLGILWLATRNGLTRFDPMLREGETFTENDGLAGAQFNRLSHLLTRKGLMYFGSSKGFSSFDPLLIPRNEFAPQIHFTDLIVNHQPQDHNVSPWLEKSFDFTSELVLPAATDHVSIKFAATNLISPAQNQYRYRFEGLEKEWLSISADLRTVQYNNLPAGHYRLQIVAANNDGVWTGGVRELAVTILPAWWRTWQAYLTYGALFVAVIYGFSMWRLHLIQKHRRKLETLVREQTIRLKTANHLIQQLNAELRQRAAETTPSLSPAAEKREELPPD